MKPTTADLLLSRSDRSVGSLRFEEVVRQQDRLYELLPAHIRTRDQQQNGHPLQALMQVLEIPLEAIEENISQLGESWFIETCPPWVVPYIADLVGFEGADSTRLNLPSLRALIGDLLSCRRAKGTPAALALMAQNATGWPCYAGALRTRLARTQTMENVQPEQRRILDLRDPVELALLNGPFDRSVHGFDCEETETTVSLERPGYDLQGIELSFWTTEVLPRRRAEPRRLADNCGWRMYSFHPFGIETRLFNFPHNLAEVRGSLKRWQAPGPLDPDLLRAEIRRRRSGQTLQTSFLGKPPVFAVYYQEGAGRPWQKVLPAEYEIVDLTGEMPDYESIRSSRRKSLQRVVLVDPEHGLLAFPQQTEGESPQEERTDEAAGESNEPFEVRVDYWYGTGAMIGGGAYRRDLAGDQGVWVGRVSKSYAGKDAMQGIDDELSDLRKALEKLHDMLCMDPCPGDRAELTAEFEKYKLLYGKKLVDKIYLFLFGPRYFTKIQDAIDAFSVITTPHDGVVTIDDSAIYAEHLTIRLSESAKSIEPYIPELGFLREALPAWGDRIDQELNTLAEKVSKPRSLTLQAQQGESPALISAAAPKSARARISSARPQVTLAGTSNCLFRLNGLWIEGTISFNEQIALRVEDCTVRPPMSGKQRPAILYVETIRYAGGTVAAAAPDFRVQSSIVGPIRLPARLGALIIQDSIIDGGRGGISIRGIERGFDESDSIGPPTRISRSTVLGGVSLQELWQCDEVLFAAPAFVSTRQGMRLFYCYAPEASALPIIEPENQGSAAAPWADLKVVDGRPPSGRKNPDSAFGPLIVPVFESTRYGDSGYARLSPHCSAQIREGGALGGEIGVFAANRRMDRQINLNHILEEFLPWGMEPRIARVT